jgi:hypothetical protein
MRCQNAYCSKSQSNCSWFQSSGDYVPLSCTLFKETPVTFCAFHYTSLHVQIVFMYPMLPVPCTTPISGAQLLTFHYYAPRSNKQTCHNNSLQFLHDLTIQTQQIMVQEEKRNSLLCNLHCERICCEHQGAPRCWAIEHCVVSQVQEGGRGA